MGSAGDLLHRTTAKTMEVLTTTGLTTKAVLTAVSDHRWWKDSLNYLRPLQVRAPRLITSAKEVVFLVAFARVHVVPSVNMIA